MRPPTPSAARSRGTRAATPWRPRPAPSSCPGRYAATTGAESPRSDDPLAAAGQRLLGAFTAIPRGYEIVGPDVDHPLRTLRSLFYGFATLQVANGFQWSADIDEGLQWLIASADRGLRALWKPFLGRVDFCRWEAIDHCHR